MRKYGGLQVFRYDIDCHSLDQIIDALALCYSSLVDYEFNSSFFSCVYF